MTFSSMTQAKSRKANIATNESDTSIISLSPISSNFKFSLHSSSTPSLFGYLSSVPPRFIKHYNFPWFQSLQILVISILAAHWTLLKGF